MHGTPTLRAPWIRLAVLLLAAGALTACASIGPRYSSRGAGPPTGEYKVGKPYQVAGVWYVPREQPNYNETGVGSWYGDEFHGKPTANGEIFDMHGVSAAHTTLPLPSLVEVTNLENGRRLRVRVNDRGPFVGGRIIDLSHEAARQLGYDQRGVTRVRVRYVGRAPLTAPEAVRYASAPPARNPDPPPPPPTRTLRIQAAAFSSEANARRAVDQLAPAGRAMIEPFERRGLVFYRVLLEATDEAEAIALRDRVVEIGFAGARVVRPF